MHIKSRYNSMQVAPYVFILPFIMSFLIFYLYPILSTFVMSFQQVYPGQVEFIGWTNYGKLNNPEFQGCLCKTVRYTVYIHLTADTHTLPWQVSQFRNLHSIDLSSHLL